MSFFRHFGRRKLVASACVAACVSLLLAVVTPLPADGTNAPQPAPAPVVAPAPDAAPGVEPVDPNEDFGKYLVDHQKELGPFYDKYGDALLKQALPLIFAVALKFILLNIVIGWIFNIGISFAFSKLFAPTFAKVKRAIIYATGCMVLNGITVLLTGLLAWALGQTQSIPLVVVGIIIVVFIGVAVQTVWVIFMYRTKAVVSALFYLTLLGINEAAGTLVTGSFAEKGFKSMLTQFVDQNITVQLKDSTADIRQEYNLAVAARDKAQADTDAANHEYDQATKDEKTLQQQIEDKKKSASQTYVKIVGLHAAGKLTEARDQFTAFLTQFPSDPLSGAARDQLAQVESELSAQEAAKRQADADALAAAAQARADFLARAAKGEITLSEMRLALYGKTRDQVSALLGAPAETASDRWGYAQQMIVDPMTSEKHGLAVYFVGGTVQSVDNYYGAGGGTQ